MTRILRWCLVGAAGLATVVVFALAGALAASELMIRWPAQAPKVQLTAARDPAAVARGRRVAILNGCHDCHGKSLEGLLFHDEMPIIRGRATNLTLVSAKASDAQLDAAIRHGVGVDGRPLWIMPSNAFALMDDQETSDLIAYMRTFGPTGEAQAPTTFGPLARVGILIGQFQSEPATLKANAGRQLPSYGAQHEAGRSVARLCVECHGPELKGGGFTRSPDLSVAAAYDLADFKTLLHTGKAAGGRELGLMSSVSRTRFIALSDGEIRALHDYLKARADAQPAI